MAGSAVMVAAGTLVSAFWILSANSWMHTPAGYEMRDGVVHVTSWWDAVFNPSFPYRLSHMVVACFVTTGFAVAGATAWQLLRGEHAAEARHTLSMTLWLLTVLVPLLFLTTLISIGLALAVAYVRGSFTDRMVMIVCTVGLSISILVYIIVFQYVFAYKLGWFPVQGWGDSFLENLFVYASLPILIALVVSIAPNLRLYRTFVLDEINQDYVRTARAKGVSENRIMWIHVLRNASIPIITFLMAELPGLLLGSFLIERFFSIPGIGREVILAVERSDFPVIKAITVYVAFATIATNLLADLTYKAVDPRVQLK